MSKMNKDVKRKWVKRLRELPNERQGRGFLRDAYDKMCCLGVLCEIAVEEGVVPSPILKRELSRYSYAEGNAHYLPESVVKWAGLEGTGGNDERAGHNPYLGKHPAAIYNDDHRKNFDQIANLINRYL